MLHRVLIKSFSLAAFAVVFSSSDFSLAQTNSLFGNRGPASQIGSNLNGSIVGGTTTFGTQSGTGLGGGVTGLSGQPISGGLGTTAGGTGTPGTQGAFVGRDDSAGRFVGDQRFGQQSAGGRTGSGLRQFGNRAGAGGTTGQAFGDSNRFGNRGGRNSTRRVIRPRQVIAFTYPKPPTSRINSSLGTRFRKVALRQPTLKNVSVVVDNEGNATLSGKVNSPEDRRLAAIMVRLEPGVRSIDNELTVSGP